MANAVIVLDLLLKLTETFLLTAERYRSVIETARSEGRDISDEELDELRKLSTDKLDELKQKVN